MTINEAGLQGAIRSRQAGGRQATRPGDHQGAGVPETSTGVRDTRSHNKFGDIIDFHEAAVKLKVTHGAVSH